MKKDGHGVSIVPSKRALYEEMPNSYVLGKLTVTVITIDPGPEVSVAKEE